MQLDHYSSKFKKQLFPIILVCDTITNASNVGSIFRTADAFGVEKVIFCGKDISLGRKMTKTSRATENVVNYEMDTNISNVVSVLKTKGYQIISLEITSNSKPINQFQFSKEKPIALIVGDENFGVSEAILDVSDAIIHIDMFGQNSSMNVVQATNIGLYEITKQLKSI